MVDIEKAKESYAECNSCGSTDDVHYLKIGRESKTCIKLCNGCRGDVINLFKEITEAY